MNPVFMLSIDSFRSFSSPTRSKVSPGWSIASSGKRFSCMSRRISWAFADDASTVAVTLTTRFRSVRLMLAYPHPSDTSAAAASYTKQATREDRKKEASINRIIGSDLVYWLAIRAARSLLLGLLGVAKEVRKGLTLAEMAQADRFLEAMLPMSRRWKGVLLDQSRYMPPDVSPEQIHVPGLVIHARDDGLVDWSNGRHAAASVAGAEFMTIERGGHLLLGHYDAIRTKVTAFLARVFGREEMP